MEEGDARPRPALAQLCALRPALGCVLLFATGILLHRPLPHLPGLWLIMLALLLAGAVLMMPYVRTCCACIAAAVLLAGVSAAQINAFHFPDNHISSFASDEPRLAQLQLRIDAPPRVLSTPGAQRPLPPRQFVLATVTSVRTWDGWKPATGEILLSLTQPHPRLAAGQTVRITGMLQRPAPAMNPGQFDWERYYRDKRILASIRVAQPENLAILHQRRFMPLHTLRQEVRHALAMGFTTERSLDHALLRALLVGDRDPEMRDIQEQFRRTGTSHHLAISGLHVGILTGFVYLVCRLLRRSPRTTAWVLLGFVALYGLIALPSTPVVRAVLLCGALAVGMVSRRSVDSVQLLAMAALAMLVYRPLDLYNAGFQLSFLTVLGLVVLTRPVARWLNSRFETEVDDPHPGPPSLVVRARRRAVEIACAAAVAWAVSLPLVAFHFERLNPWAMAGSVLLAPVVMMILGAGLLKIVLTLLLPSLAGPLAAVAATPVVLMRFMVDALERLPLADVPVGPWSVAAVLGYYLLLVMPMRQWRTGLLRRAFRFAPPAACLLALAVPFTLGLTQRPSGDRPAVLTVLAVGAGQCAVLRLPSGQVVLMDAGSTSLGELVRTCAAPFLRHHRIRRIESLYLSHPHYDHFSGATDLLDLYDVRLFFGPAGFDAGARGNPPAEALLDALRAAGRPLQTLHAGHVQRLDDNTTLEVLWPPPHHRLDPDNGSLVLRITHGGTRILIPGDIQETAMRSLLESGMDLRSEVLIAPHHGSSEVSTARFVAAVDPAVIVASNARRLSMKQHELDLLVRGRPLYRTHQSGALAITLSADGAFTVAPHLQNAPLPPMRFDPAGSVDSSPRLQSTSQILE